MKTSSDIISDLKNKLYSNFKEEFKYLYNKKIDSYIYVKTNDEGNKYMVLNPPNNTYSVLYVNDYVEGEYRIKYDTDFLCYVLEENEYPFWEKVDNYIANFMIENDTYYSKISVEDILKYANTSGVPKGRD